MAEVRRWLGDPMSHLAAHNLGLRGNNSSSLDNVYKMSKYSP